MAGIFYGKNVDKLSTFVYLLMESDCTIPLQYMITATNVEFHDVAWSQDESHAYIIGKGTFNEYLIVI